MKLQDLAVLDVVGSLTGSHLECEKSSRHVGGAEQNFQSVRVDVEGEDSVGGVRVVDFRLYVSRDPQRPRAGQP